MAWFLYDRGLRHERVKKACENIYFTTQKNLRATIAMSIWRNTVLIELAQLYTLILNKIYNNCHKNCCRTITRGPLCFADARNGMDVFG